MLLFYTHGHRLNYGVFPLRFAFHFYDYYIGKSCFSYFFLCVIHMPRLYKLATLTSLMEYGFVSPWNGEHRCVT